MGQSNLPPRTGDVASDLAAYLTHLKQEGQPSIDVSRERVEALGAVPVGRSPKGPAPAGVPASPDGGGAPGLDGIAARIAECTLCPLCETRTNTVPGQGAPNPDIAFVGEGPGADEDRQGEAFVGRAGKLLTKMIGAMGLSREEVWIGNIVKCRPPENRTPYPDEMEACLPYLREQLSLLNPRVIVCLGATAVKGLLKTRQGITKIRGTWMKFEDYDVMPTFHPAYLLRNPPAKREAWEDLQAVLRKLGRTPPEWTGKKKDT